MPPIPLHIARHAPCVAWREGGAMWRVWRGARTVKTEHASRMDVRRANASDAEDDGTSRASARAYVRCTRAVLAAQVREAGTSLGAAAPRFLAPALAAPLPAAP